MACTLDTLLVLSRSLTGAKQGGVLADALDLLLTGIGCSRGAAYSVVGDTLELVSERGLPVTLRAPLERLSLTQTSFAAQRAAQTRKLVWDRDLGASAGSPHERAALALARWGQVVACPIAAGREVFGVLVFAWPLDDEPYYLGLAVIEIACNMMAIQMGRLRQEQRQAEVHGGGARAERMTALGILASGFAEDVDLQLAEIGRRLGDQQQLLGPARETAARFLSAIRPSAPARLDLGALVADVLALAAPHLRRRRIDVQLRVAGEHLVVGRRSELMQLFLQLALHTAGVSDDSDDVYSDRGALIPRAFAFEVRRQTGHEVVSVIDAGDDWTGARSSFFGAQGCDLGFDLGAARRIVVAHEGHIEIGSGGETGGARCTVVLPRADVDRRASRLALSARRPRSDRPRPVLLWIDEDELFLEIMVQSLQEFDNRIARDAAEAMQLLAFDGMNPTLVLSNVRLPDRPGHELHAEVARRMPRVAERFVFITDGVLTPAVASYLIASGRPTLMRPIDLDRLRTLAQRDQAASGQAAATAPTLTGVRVDPRHAPTEPALPTPELPAPSDADREALPPPPARGAPPVTPPGLRDKKTVPERPRVSDPLEARAPVEGSGLLHPAGERSSSMRDNELIAISRVIANTVRREGPKRGGIVLAMLRERGLSEPEALSVITFALSKGILVRDPHPSTLLRLPDVAPCKTVLVVDDDFDLRQTLREVLQDEGYTVDTAANGREALDLLRRSNPPRVMVLDLMMPVMDGWQLLDELKRDESLADIPVVVISASKHGLCAPAHDGGSAPKPPANHEMLSKPLDYYKLVTTLDRSMRRPVSLT